MEPYRRGTGKHSSSDRLTDYAQDLEDYIRYRCGTSENPLSRSNRLANHTRDHEDKLPSEKLSLRSNRLASPTQDHKSKCYKFTSEKSSSRSDRLESPTQDHKSKRYKCGTCGQIFAQGRDLRKHDSVHLGENLLKYHSNSKKLRM